MQPIKIVHETIPLSQTKYHNPLYRTINAL